MEGPAHQAPPTKPRPPSSSSSSVLGSPFSLAAVFLVRMRTATPVGAEPSGVIRARREGVWVAGSGAAVSEPRRRGCGGVLRAGLWGLVGRSEPGSRARRRRRGDWVHLLPPSPPRGLWGWVSGSDPGRPGCQAEAPAWGRGAVSAGAARPPRGPGF